MTEITQAQKDNAIQHKLAAIFAANKDEVSIPKIYIDMVGDHAAAAVLDELLFWTLPKPKTGKTSLRVFRNGYLWLAVRRTDWWDRKRLTERQADVAIAKLVKFGMVEKDVFLFDGKPTVHLRMIMSVFAKAYSDKLTELAKSENDENTVKDLQDLYEMMGFPINQTVNSNLPNGEMLNLQNGEIINSPVQPEYTSSATTLPEAEWPLDWKIAKGEAIVGVQDDFLASVRDRANLIDMGCAGAGGLAEAFMRARGILIPEAKVKGNRKAAREMLEMKVKPEHVTQAVQQLTEKKMTITDLFSVSKTAIDLANKQKPQADKPNQRGINYL